MPHIRISIIDLLVVAAFVLFVASSSINCNLFPGRDVLIAGNYLMLFFILRVAISHRRGLSDSVFVGIVALCVISESLFGLEQLVGLEHSNNFLYPVTGHFLNPGPFGGLIAATGIVAAVYCLKHDTDNPLFVLSLVAAVAAAALLPVSQSRAAMLGYVLAAVAVGLNEKSVRRYLLKHKWIIAVACLFIFAAGVFMYKAKKPSADGRIFIACITAKIIKDNWATGTCNFAGEYGKCQHDYFADKGVDGYESRICGCPDNAFNEYLQTGADYGLVVMILFVVMVVTCCIILVRHSAHLGAGCIALGVFAMFSYPFDMVVFKLLLTLYVSFAASYGKPLRRSVSWLVLPAVLLYVLSVPCQIRQRKSLKEAERFVYKADSFARREQYKEACAEFEKAFDALQHDYEFLFRYGHTLHKAGLFAESSNILLKGAEISSDPMFHDIIGKNYKELGNFAEAEQEFETAFLMLPNRLYPLYLLARLYYDTDQTDKFVEMAARVDEFKPKVDSPATDRLKAEIGELLRTTPSW